MWQYGTAEFLVACVVLQLSLVAYQLWLGAGYEQPVHKIFTLLVSPAVRRHLRETARRPADLDGQARY